MCRLTRSTEVANGGVLQKGVLKNFAKFTGKHLCKSLFLNKVAGHRLCFPLNFAKFFRTSFFIEHLRANASGSIIHHAIAIVFMRVSF